MAESKRQATDFKNKSNSCITFILWNRQILAVNLPATALPQKFQKVSRR